MIYVFVDVFIKKIPGIPGIMPLTAQLAGNTLTAAPNIFYEKQQLFLLKSQKQNFY